jgi:hypothetical protein
METIIILAGLVLMGIISTTVQLVIMRRKEIKELREFFD